MPSVEQHGTPSLDNNEKLKEMQNNFTESGDDSSPPKASKIEKKPEMPPAVTTIADMNNLLYQSRISYESKAPGWSSRADKVLLEARFQIENAPIIKNDPQLYAPLYRNVSMFKRSYELMERTLKVYVYKEGKKPILHMPVLESIYGSEGWFMKQLKTNKKFVTENPSDAHLFYLPFSSRMLKKTLYNYHRLKNFIKNLKNYVETIAEKFVTKTPRDAYLPSSSRMLNKTIDDYEPESPKNLIQYLKNYVDTIAAKYPFWNRTEGADHFLVACHDWAPSETREPMANCIRSLCNADVTEGYIFSKDASLPVTYVRNLQKPLEDLGGNRPSNRPILAFFAGSMHGYLRPILLEQWGNKDPDMKIFGKMPNVKGKMNYIQHMKSSKYCLCVRGYKVHTPRVVEAIFYECVPVIIADNFVPPFFEVLNWESFAVFVLEKDILNLKKILLSIPEERYLQMHSRVKKIQKHFLWHTKPEKYDVFHMILHSVWYNRVFQMKSR
ncbi:probable glycosyltransferase At5g03795 isoform X2 [Hibiscus syriacus]|nr:probable glycosyltransferase At5g03795 isoform X2 [Hibiscus syriacus]XP_039030301.1 probable glycosyltransferase At5g03795 isoform X2 [Hibiscus syriacus]